MRLTANQIVDANLIEPGTFTKADHAASRGCELVDMLLWNILFKSLERYTDEELASQKRKQLSGLSA